MINNYQDEDIYLDTYQDLDLPFYYNPGDVLKFEGAFMTFFVISSVLSYLAIAVALQKIAKRLEIQDDWYAWVPVLNLILLLKIVKKPQSSVFLFFIPIVGFFFSVTVWMELAVTLSKPKWLGVFAAIPFVKIFAHFIFSTWR